MVEVFTDRLENNANDGVKRLFVDEGTDFHRSKRDVSTSVGRESRLVNVCLAVCERVEKSERGFFCGKGEKIE